MSRISPLSGFPEFLPSQRAAELAVIDSLRETFELHGFASLETRAVEPLDQLLRKGETSKEVYVLRRLQAERDDTDTGLGLHFDLTVPLARYVLENAGKLEFPLRRYQIQRCWRGERPQEGRYREFTQADIDIIGRDELSFDADVEVTEVMAAALSRLPLPAVTLQVNNRKLIEGFYTGLGAADPAAVIRVVDKLDKHGADAVRTQLCAEAGLDDAQVDQCLALARITGTDASFAEDVRALGVTHPLLEEGLRDLVRAIEAAAPFRTEQFAVVADLKIARGLDYYTGTVFEGRMATHGDISICAGGRYDALAFDGRTTYPGVGISLGVTRVLAPLIGRGLLDGSRSVPSAVLVALPADEDRPRAREVARALRERGIATEVAPSAARFGKQIRHADRRGIPFVWFPGGPDRVDSVKDIRSGEQVDADPDAWRPPTADLRPQIVTKETHP
ncbi:MAG: histidine--tRNA ligase [Actinomycetota bacterium]|nr:histidine--tRNA ligase [Actinomycetota bacterium]